MTYPEILQQLQQHANYEKTAVSRDISKLDAIRQLLNDLGNPQESLQVIHIAGTNGKGLTATMLSNIFLAEGMSTGRYSSPHLVDIRERICLSEEWVSEDVFAKAASQVLKTADAASYGKKLSYFDILTAVAFLVFEQAQVDWVLLETGLGGLSDSTNVAPKKIAVITNIGYDHTNILGNTLEEIATQKLGITRPGVMTVLASQKPEIGDWMEQWLKEHDTPFVTPKKCQLKKVTYGYELEWGDDSYFVRGSEVRPMPQWECIKTALLVREQLSPIIDNKNDRDGDLNPWFLPAWHTRMPGRLERREATSDTPMMVLDGGHNADALEALATQLEIWEIHDYVLILGLAKDKLTPSLQEPLIHLCDKASKVYLPDVEEARSLPAQQLSETLEAWLPNPSILKTGFSPEKALETARKHQKTIVISGSFYLLSNYTTQEPVAVAE